MKPRTQRQTYKYLILKFVYKFLTNRSQFVIFTASSYLLMVNEFLCNKLATSKLQCESKNWTLLG